MRTGRFVLIVALWATAAVACTPITHSKSERKTGAPPAPSHASTTTTVKPRPTTTTTGPDPITSANQAIASWSATRQGSTAISIGDIDDGVVTDLGPVHATALWNASDGSLGLQVTKNAAGLDNTAYQHGHGWGFALTTAHDQAKVEAKLAAGIMLDADDTALVLHLMRNVVPSEQWGFADTVAKSLEPAHRRSAAPGLPFLAYAQEVADQG